MATGLLAVKEGLQQTETIKKRCWENLTRTPVPIWLRTPSRPLTQAWRQSASCWLRGSF